MPHSIQNDIDAQLLVIDSSMNCIMEHALPNVFFMAVCANLENVINMGSDIQKRVCFYLLLRSVSTIQMQESAYHAISILQCLHLYREFEKLCPQVANRVIHIDTATSYAAYRNYFYGVQKRFAPRPEIAGQDGCEAKYQYTSPSKK